MFNAQVSNVTPHHIVNSFVLAFVWQEKSGASSFTNDWWLREASLVRLSKIVSKIKNSPWFTNGFMALLLKFKMICVAIKMICVAIKRYC